MPELEKDVIYNRAYVGSTPTPTTDGVVAELADALDSKSDAFGHVGSTPTFLIQERIYMKRITVTVDLTRYVTETWEVDVKPHESVEEVIKDIQENPDEIWYRHSNLVNADDWDEIVTKTYDIGVIDNA